MRLWRVILPRRAGEALSGEGARRFGGRWNRQGQAAVYTSTTASLAMLEWLAHVDAADAPPELVAIAYELPDDEAVTRMGMSELPTGWRASPAPEDLRRIGIEWLDAGETVALVVPSVVLPLGDEQNLVLNPATRAWSPERGLPRARNGGSAANPQVGTVTILPERNGCPDWTVQAATGYALRKAGPELSRHVGCDQYPVPTLECAINCAISARFRCI
ncbi:MAG: hypothetical protein BRC36_03005 [Cyanobacteria bacterium QH_2_48_84]|nr:MAG: hypothetical protein BRC36_03005 [Cyanobacteria bacterium QH_2_48_84]